MSTRSFGLPAGLQKYLLSLSVPLDLLWERLRDETLRVAGITLQISPGQA